MRSRPLASIWTTCPAVCLLGGLALVTAGCGDSLGSPSLADVATAGPLANNAPHADEGEHTPGNPADTVAVLSLVEPGSPFAAVAQRLADRHAAPIVRATPQNVDEARDELAGLAPTHVAIVVAPDDLDENLAAAVFSLMTRLDDDPFADAGWGYLTGRDADAALALVESSDPARPAPRSPSLGQYGVADGAFLKTPQDNRVVWPLPGGTMRVHSLMAVDTGDAVADAAFLEAGLTALERDDLLLFASHGQPDGLVGGPKARDLAGRRFEGAVVFNLACFNGVCSRWYDTDWAAGTTKARTVSREDSFVLALLETGVAGVFTHLSARPAGPTMMGQALRLASEGRSLGQMQQDDANRVILAHLLRGHDRLDFAPLVDGAAVTPPSDGAEAVHRSSTGGVVFGDPTVRPFAPTGGHVQTTTTQLEGEQLIAKTTLVTPLMHAIASDPLNYHNGNKPAWHVLVEVPLGDREATAVRVRESSLGLDNVRLVAATDETGGSRILRVKVQSPQPQPHEAAKFSPGLSLTLEVDTVAHQPEPREPVVLRSTEDDPAVAR